MARALVVVAPDLEMFWQRVCQGDPLTIEEQGELLGVAADLLALVLVLEERLGESPRDRRAA